MIQVYILVLDEYELVRESRLILIIDVGYLGLVEERFWCFVNDVPGVFDVLEQVFRGMSLD